MILKPQTSLFYQQVQGLTIVKEASFVDSMFTNASNFCTKSRKKDNPNLLLLSNDFLEVFLKVTS